MTLRIARTDIPGLVDAELVDDAGATAQTFTDLTMGQVWDVARRHRARVVGENPYPADSLVGASWDLNQAVASMGGIIARDAIRAAQQARRLGVSAREFFRPTA